jgi:predicted amidohydrolase
MLRIGMGQMRVEPAEPGRNMERAVGMIREAAAAGCAVVVLPECFDVGWTHPAAKELARPIPGDRSAMLSAAARSTGLWIVAGVTERDGDPIYNSAVLIAPDGAIALRHRKINELDIATSLYATGTGLSVAATSFGSVGVTICADNFPDSLMFGESLARMGAQLILSPCAWAVDADHDNTAEPYGQLWLDAYVPLARAYDVTVIGVSNVGWLTGGPWKGRKCIGCSLAVGPGGDVLARGPYGEDAEALVTVDVAVRRPIGIGTGFAEALRRRSAVQGTAPVNTG